MDLTDVGKPEYRLFDAQRLRFVPKVPSVYLAANELARANEYFVKSFCPHLQWVLPEEQPVRRYTIKNG